MLASVMLQSRGYAVLAVSPTKTKNQKPKPKPTMKRKQSTMAARSAFAGVLALAAAAALVPGSASAIIIDLTATPTSAGASVTTADGVVWSQTDQQPTGTGVIKPFLRLKDSSSGAGEFTQGYNTSIAPLPMDDLGTADQWVHNV